MKYGKYFDHKLYVVGALRTAKQMLESFAALTKRSEGILKRVNGTSFAKEQTIMTAPFTT